ncbi:MAG: hypothetical protein IJ620_04020 [Bacteroidales bacterium]|nr:hypothetical protein [Bacteroidales bacterium]
MKRRLATLLLTLIALSATAQNGVNLPFSQYAISMSSSISTTPLASSMGGVVYTRSGSNFVNPYNPASYASLQMESFVFDISMNLNSSRLTSGGQSVKDFDGSLSSIAIAFPVTKFWKTSLGLLPFSSTNYQTVVTQSIPGTTEQVKNIYDGSGGVSQFIWGNAFNILGGDPAKPSLQAGFNLNYLYGAMSQAITYDFVASDENYYQDTRRQKDTRVSNLTFDLGLLYRQPLNADYTLTAGLSIQLPQRLTVKDQSLIYTFVGTTTAEYTLDTIFPARGASSEYNSHLEQPLGVGLGLAIERNDRWTVALDMAYAPYSGLKYEEGIANPIFGDNGLRYGSNYRVALGGGWLGNPMASNYIGRMGLTGGVHYEHGVLDLALANGDWTLNEWGCSAGITFPMRKGRSKLVLTASYSNFGDSDLLCSEVLSIGLSLSSNERWFVKRKYN